jgi:hypothetical protein
MERSPNKSEVRKKAETRNLKSKNELLFEVRIWTSVGCSRLWLIFTLEIGVEHFEDWAAPG